MWSYQHQAIKLGCRFSFKKQPVEETILAKVNNIWRNNGAYSSSRRCDAQAHAPDHSGHQLSQKNIEETVTTGDANPSNQGEHLQNDWIFCNGNMTTKYCF